MIQDTLQRLRRQQLSKTSDSGSPPNIELGLEQAHALGDILAILDQPASRKAIGLFGRRGSGKTVLLTEIAQDSLRSHRTPQHRKVVCAVVNAANLPTDLAPWQRLIFATLDKLAQQPGASTTINDLRAELQELVQHEANNDDSATLAAAAFAHHLRAAFAGLVHSAITLSNTTFVVAIDHLDKTTAENATQLLEASKYFLNAQNCATLICADEPALLDNLGGDGRGTLGAWLTSRVELRREDWPTTLHVTTMHTREPIQIEASPVQTASKPASSDIPQPCMQVFAEALNNDRYAIERAGDYWRSAMRALAKRNADGYGANVTGIVIAKLCAVRVLSPGLFDAIRFDAPALVTLERRARTLHVASEGHDEWTEALTRDPRLTALFKAPPSFIGLETRDLATALRLVQTGDSEINQVHSLMSKPASSRTTILGAPASSASASLASVPSATTMSSAAPTMPTAAATPRPRRESRPVAMPSAVWSLVSIAAGAFILDRLIKMAVQSGVTLFGGMIQLQPPVNANVINNGIAIGAELLALALCALIVLFTGRRLTGARAAGFGLILGGLAGNLFDRLVHGATMNYLHVANLPVFNLAHAALLAGVICLLYAMVANSPGSEHGRDATLLAHE